MDTSSAPGISVRRESVAVDGLRRTYNYVLPGWLAPQPALVFVFHGSDGDGRRARRATGYSLDKLAKRHGFIVVYPDGFEKHWNGCRKAGPYSANRLGIDDVKYVETLIDRFAEGYHIDTDQVFAMGMSNGGHMAYRLGLELPHRVKAIAAMIASLPDDSNMDCKPKGLPVAVMIVNGTDDPINPYTGGRVALLGQGDRGTVLSTQETFTYWLGLSGNKTTPVHIRLPNVNLDDNSWLERTTVSTPGVPEISLYTVHGGGHTLPHPYIRWPRVLGTNNRDINIIEEAWHFFARQKTPVLAFTK